MSNILCWNVRGFNQPFKSKEVKNLIKSRGIGLCGLVETHVAKVREVDIFNRMFRGWEWVSNSALCNRGTRIVIGWDPRRFEVLVLYSEKQVVHCLVKVLESHNHFFCSVIYAANEHVERRQLWHSLRVHSQLVGVSPWVLLGDLNTTLVPEETMGGSGGVSTSMLEFRECVSNINVMDLNYSGMQFTWSGSPHGVGVVKKLDRVLVNAAFLSIFRGARAVFLPHGVSDHSPATVMFEVERRGKVNPFRFYNYLAHRDNFTELV